MANYTTAIVVKHLCSATSSVKETLDSIQLCKLNKQRNFEKMTAMYIEEIVSRIYNLNDLQNKAATWRQQGQKIVFTNGCFDILHAGHVTYLAAAADTGDKLIIGLNADVSIAHLKGANRPVIQQDQRAFLLAALLFVDAVILFKEDTPLQLINALQPDVLVKGGDYTEDKIVGAAEVKARGGTIKIIPFVAGLSTSGIIAKIKG